MVILRKVISQPASPTPIRGLNHTQLKSFKEDIRLFILQKLMPNSIRLLCLAHLYGAGNNRNNYYEAPNDGIEYAIKQDQLRFKLTKNGKPIDYILHRQDGVIRSKNSTWGAQATSKDLSDLNNLIDSQLLFIESFDGSSNQLASNFSKDKILWWLLVKMAHNFTNLHSSLKSSRRLVRSQMSDKDFKNHVGDNEMLKMNIIKILETFFKRTELDLSNIGLKVNVKEGVMAYLSDFDKSINTLKLCHEKWGIDLLINYEAINPPISLDKYKTKELFQSIFENKLISSVESIKKINSFSLEKTRGNHKNNDVFLEISIQGILIRIIMDGVGSADEFKNAIRMKSELLNSQSTGELDPFIESLKMGDYDLAINQLINFLSLKMKPFGSEPECGGEYTFCMVFQMNQGGHQQIHTIYTGDSHAYAYNHDLKELSWLTMADDNAGTDAQSISDLKDIRSYTIDPNGVRPGSHWSLSHTVLDNPDKSIFSIVMGTDGVWDLLIEKAAMEHIQLISNQTHEVYNRRHTFVDYDMKAIQTICQVCDGDPNLITEVVRIFLEKLANGKADDRTFAAFQLGEYLDSESLEDGLDIGLSLSNHGS